MLRSKIIEGPCHPMDAPRWMPVLSNHTRRQEPSPFSPPAPWRPNDARAHLSRHKFLMIAVIIGAAPGMAWLIVFAASVSLGDRL